MKQLDSDGKRHVVPSQKFPVVPYQGETNRPFPVGMIVGTWVNPDGTNGIVGEWYCTTLGTWRTYYWGRFGYDESSIIEDALRHSGSFGNPPHSGGRLFNRLVRPALTGYVNSI